MRLFIAINFEEKIKNYLSLLISELKKEDNNNANFTRPENLHLTLSFIGETTNITPIKDILEHITMSSFDIKIGGLNRFKRENGDIYFVNVIKNPNLTELYEYLYTNLKAASFNVEDRAFKPHLTLGRQVVINNQKAIEDINKQAYETCIHVQRVSLMKSERINGKLTYTEIFYKELN